MDGATRVGRRSVGDVPALDPVGSHLPTGAGAGLIRAVPRSLAGRIALAISLLQVAVVLGGMAAWMLTSPYVTWDDVGSETAATLVRDAVQRGEDGVPVLVTTPALAAYAARRPSLRWAVLVEGRVLPGGSPDLAELLGRLGPLLPREGRLAVPLAGGTLAAFAPGETTAGHAVVVTAGNVFHADDDLGTFFSVYAMQLVPMFGPAILAALVAIPLTIRSMLRPVREAARALAAIDLLSLDQRLPVAQAPVELRPFLGAINTCLARLEEGVRRQRVFTANAAHELRTPVAILQARVEVMPADAGQAALLRDLRRLTILIDQMLAVARLGQREAAVTEPLDLAAVARGVTADMAPLAIRAGRALAVEQRDAPRGVTGNARALESALANLVENALRAEPAGGTVVVTVGPGARLAVTDHGAGVAPEDRAFVFEPFWRREDGARGTGLGLAIVREAMRLHGGRVRVEETPGGGATFVLELPGPA